MTKTRILSTLMIGAALSGLAGLASAEPFTIFVYEPATEIALRTDATEVGAAYWADWTAFSVALAQAGAIQGGAPLMVEAAGDAPVLSGYFIIDAATPEAAQALADASPAEARGGMTVLTSHFPTPAMSN